MRSRSPSPQTRAIVCALLRSNPEWRHGYDLSRETGVAAGTLYPLLIRLSDRGLLQSQWRDSEKVGRPPRHVYRLSPQGVAFAGELSPPASSGPIGKPLRPVRQ